MKKEQLEKLSTYLENHVLKHVEGIRPEGDLSLENWRFPDTYYYCGLNAQFDKDNLTITFSDELVADKDEKSEDGLPIYYDNAYIDVEYDIINNWLTVKVSSDEENEFMQNILSELKCVIEDDEDFLKTLENETEHLRPEEEELEVTDENPNLIWDGTKSCICDFTLEVNNWGYQYLVKCVPLYDDLQEDLGAACWNEEKLIQQTLKFTEAGYACQIQKIDENYINEIKDSVCMTDR